MNEKRATAYRLGVMTFSGLAVLTLIEFWIGANFDSAVLLLIIALIKGALIVQNFMHIGRLWREESH